MDMDFAIACPLVRPVLPRIRFLFVESRFRSTLPSDSPSRFRPCVSLVLHLHQVAQGTFTPKLLGMPSAQAWPWATACGGKGLTFLVTQHVATMRSTVEPGCGKSCAKVLDISVFIRIPAAIDTPPAPIPSCTAGSRKNWVL